MSISKKLIVVAGFSVLTLGLVGGTFVANAQSNSAEIFSFGHLGKFGRDDQFRGQKGGFGKMGKNLTKPNVDIDPSLTESLKKAQEELKTASKNLMEAKKTNSGNLEELRAKMIESKKAVQVASGKVRQAVTEAKINSAKTLGVEQAVIDNFIKAQASQQEMQNQMENLRANDSTTLGQIKDLKNQMNETRQSFQEARRAFQEALSAKQK